MKRRYVDTGIIRRGKNYTFTVAMGMDESKKQIRKTKTYSPPPGISEQKADKLAREEYFIFKQHCKGFSNYNENIRFHDLCDQYFRIYATNCLKPVTLYNYRTTVNRHFIKKFGNYRLKDITTGYLSDYFCSLTVTGVGGKPEPMNPNTVKTVFHILKSIFHFAVSQNYIMESPCRNVILPRPHTEPGRKFLCENEYTDFLSLFDGYSVLNVFVKALFYTGMRCGELLGLQWSDIDFSEQTIRISHTLARVNGEYMLTSPKTFHSRRTIFIPEPLCALLQHHKTQQMLLQESVPAFSHPEMVFTSRQGGYQNRCSMAVSFRNCLKGTAYEFMTLHCLRHSNATLLLNKGVDIKVVSDHLGHSDITTTANIYAAVLDERRRHTAEIIAASIK